MCPYSSSVSDAPLINKVFVKLCEPNNSLQKVKNNFMDFRGIKIIFYGLPKHKLTNYHLGLVI